MLWVDSRLAYSHSLHEGRKKRLISWKRAAKETITIPVASGKHQLRVRVRSSSDSYDGTKAVSANLPKNGETTLAVQFAKDGNTMTLSVR